MFNRQLIYNPGKGAALITVLFITVILFILGTAIMIYANGDLFAASAQKNQINALYLAQTGVIYAYYELSSFNLSGANKIYEYESPQGPPPEGMTTGRFVIKAELNPDNTVSVTSTGVSGKIRRTVYAVFASNNSKSSYKLYP